MAIGTALAKNSNYQKFIILTAPRSGSTLLHTYLNSHPQIHSLGEIPWRDQEKGIQKNYFSPLPNLIKTSGMKVFYQFCDQEPYRELYHKILAEEEMKVIHLERGNYLEQYISLKQAWEKRNWSQSNPSSSGNHQITLVKEDFEVFKNQQENEKKKCLTDFQDHALIHISYDELIQLPTDTLLKVQHFLGVRPRKLISLLQKQQTQPLEELIENADEAQQWYPQYFA